MKNSKALASIMAIAMMSEAMNVTGQGSVSSGKRIRITKTEKHIPFNKKEGVLKMIKDYSLIKKGKSKKGIRKQARIKNKVDEWLKSGILTEEDLATEGRSS
jgi:hypothetical protein